MVSWLKERRDRAPPVYLSAFCWPQHDNFQFSTVMNTWQALTITWLHLTACQQPRLIRVTTSWISTQEVKLGKEMWSSDGVCAVDDRSQGFYTFVEKFKQVYTQSKFWYSNMGKGITLLLILTLAWPHHWKLCFQDVFGTDVLIIHW